jgi:hypothetical protein
MWQSVFFIVVTIFLTILNAGYAAQSFEENKIFQSLIEIVFSFIAFFSMLKLIKLLESLSILVKNTLKK